MEAINRKSLKAIKMCAEWLIACLKIGWSKKDLSQLEQLFWDKRNWQTGAINHG